VRARFRATALAVGITAVAIAAPAGAQFLGPRVSAVRDGIVLVSFAGRPGLCGAENGMIRFGERMYSFNGSIGRFSGYGPGCFAGPVQVTIGRAAGETVSIRTRVGRRGAAAADETDLGVVSAPEAAAYFFSQSRLNLGQRNAEQALIAAVIADSTHVTAPLTQVIRDRNARAEARGLAAMLLGDADEPESRPALRSVIADADLPRDVRGSAIVGLGERDIPLADAEFLENQYPSLNESLRSDVFLALSHADDPRIYRWVSTRAFDVNESMETRKQALFWSGQGAMPTPELVALYDKLADRELREHFTFVLTQRKDDRATDKLIDIVKTDRDKSVRNQALFWLGQSKDPKAKAFLRDLILKGQP
jgi:hypothetical protein